VKDQPDNTYAKPSREAEQVIERAARALRQTPVPHGPPTETLAAVTALAESAGDAGKARTTKERTFLMKRIVPIAAGIVAVAAVAGALLWLTVGEGGRSIAWADVQQQIGNVRTLTMKVTITHEAIPQITMRMMFKEPGLIRQEVIDPQKAVGIINMPEGRMLTLIEKEKKFIVVKLSSLSEQQMQRLHEGADFLGMMKKMMDGSKKELGEREINGRSVKGYEVKKQSQQLVMTLWADAKTGEPVEIEMSVSGAGLKIVMTDFERNKELDDKLFSLEVPEGYTPMEEGSTINLMKPASTEDMAEFLGAWAKRRGGTFPNSLSVGEFVKDEKQHDKDATDEKEKEKEKELRYGEVAGRTFMFLTTHPDVTYAGKGVKLGDAKTAVFWYRPKDSETYKVIYGDLTIKDVAEEDLPADPEEAPESE